MNCTRMAKVMVGGVLGGAIGYGAYYIWQKKPWKKERGKVVYEAKNAEEWLKAKTIAEQVAEEAAEEVMNAVEQVQEVKKIVENYIPSQHSGWRRAEKPSGPIGTNYTYVYYAEDEILVDSEMDEVDDDLFQAVLQTHSMDPGEKQLYFMDADTMDCANVTVTNEDYAAAYNRWSDARFESGDVLYPEEE